MQQWQKAESRLRIALDQFAQAAKSTYQGRLFAQDALNGLQLIDLCREVFDVVVTNPPFGNATTNYTDYLKNTFPTSYYDIYTMFVDRSLQLLHPSGFLGCITSKLFFQIHECLCLENVC